jgi:hypothetical protein
MTTRKNIMENCPEEFADELGDFIDYIESAIYDVMQYMEISDLSDLHRISNAYDDLKNLYNDL